MILAAQFVGRLHPLLVHLPIGMLLLAAILEVLSCFRKYRKVRVAVKPALFWGALTAVASAISGYFLSQEGGYDDRLIYLHQNAGIATAVYACLIYFLRRSTFTFFRRKDRRRTIRMLLLLPLVGLILVTGHFGGSITHGEDYLMFEDEGTDGGSPSLKLTSIVNNDSAKMYYDVVEPILRSRCYSCHSATKQKGQLRLDQPTFILKGGKHGPVINTVIPDSSSIYHRLMLPLEDEHHMPPNEKPQPASAELALIHSWIAEGASFEKQILAFSESAKIKSYIQTMLDHSLTMSLIPAREVNAANSKAISDLQARGVLIIPLSNQTNYLSASYVNAKTTTDEDLKLLLPLKDQLLWLNLGRTKITDAGMETVRQLSNITQLNLEYTSVHDAGVQTLGSLTNLSTLNLVNTQVGDSGLLTLAPITSLKKIFLFKTNVTAAGIRNFIEKSPKALTDTGSYNLPFRVTDTLLFKTKKSK